MFSLPLEPSSSNIIMARERAGLTQTQAAKLLGVEGAWRQWGRWERNIEPMPQPLWELFMVKVGIHPHYMPRPGVEVPRSIRHQVLAEDDAELQGQLHLARHALQKARELSRRR